jgi:SRSO17 transposase
VVPVGVRLYLPLEWAEDAARCDGAGIPGDSRAFRTKDGLALEIVREARGRGLRFGWVGADAGSGKGPGFMDALEDMGKPFVADVHSDFRVYREDPRPAAEAPGGRVRGLGVADCQARKWVAWHHHTRGLRQGGRRRRA